MKKITFLLICICALSLGQLFAQTPQTEAFTADGTFTVPEGVTEITIEAWGAGGGGGVANSDNVYTGGGGGGAYAKSVVAVSPGDVIDIKVGVGGSAELGHDHSNFKGGASSASRSSVDLVKAAGGWSVAGSATGGLGGAVADCIGDVAYAGGKGGNGDDQTFIFYGRYGGGGGGAAGANGNGYAGQSATGWWQRTDGGNGNGPYSGNGGKGGVYTTVTTHVNPADGATYGGGGGGSTRGNTYISKGGDGYVIITYVKDPCIATPGSIALGIWTCTTTDTTVALQNATSATPATGVYSWQKQNPIWMGIVGANTDTYIPATSGTYRRGYTTPGCPTVYTDPITVSVPNSTDMGLIMYNGSSTNTSESFCFGTTASVTLTTSLTGVDNSEILWQSSPDNNTWTELGTSVSYTYTNTNLQSKVYLRYSKIISPTCTIPCGNVFTVDVYQVPMVPFFTPPTDLCPGATSYDVTADIFYGTSTIITSYHWTGAIGDSPTGTITATLPNCNETYTYSLYVEDANGCVSPIKYGTFTTTNPVLSFDAVPDQLAAKGANDCEYIIPDLTELLKTYVQSTACGNAVASVTATPAIGSVITSATDVVYMVTDMCGGSSVNVPVTIIIPTSPTVTLTAEPERICFGGQSTLTATAEVATDVTYQWSTNVEDGGADNVKLTIAATGQSPLVETSTVYSVTVTDAFGCSSSAQTTVYTNPIVDGDNDFEQWMCSNDSRIYEPTAPDAPAVTTYSWTVEAPSTITGAVNGTNQSQINTGTLINTGLLKETVVYTVTPTTTLGGVSCEGNTFTYTLNIFPQINTEGAITDFDDADVIITLWYSACDTLYNVVAPTFVNNIENQSVPAFLTNDKGGEVNNGTLLGRIAPGEYTITWKVSDNCGFYRTYTKKYIVRYPNCGENDPNYTEPYIAVDADGNSYSTVRIGCDCWLAQNLASTTYDGTTAIPVAKIYKADEYPDEAANLAAFGRLYSWYSAVNVAEGNNNAVPATKNDIVTGAYVQGVCPEGWALPTDADYMRMKTLAGSIPAIKTDNTSAWLPGLAGTGASGFDAFGAGYYHFSIDRYVNLLGQTYFWTSNVGSTIQEGICSYITHSCPELIYDDQLKGMGFSVRCIKKEGTIILYN